MQAIFGTIAEHGEPMTFGELRDIAFPQGTYEGDMARILGPSNVGRVRSLRRAIQSMVKSETLVAIGKGGRADPQRYNIHPFIAVMCGIPSKADISLGHLLLEARPQIPDSEWPQYLAQFSISEARAERCMQVAKDKRGNTMTPATE
jgi:hypothetical protein